jgi:hypothetical protein
MSLAKEQIAPASGDRPRMNARKASSLPLRKQK